MKRVFLLVAALAVSGTASADISDETIYPMVWTPVITLMAGPAWAWGGRDQAPFTYTNAALVNSPAYRVYIHTDHKASTVGTGELFFGLQRPVFNGVLGQAGLSIAGASNVEFNGPIYFAGLINQPLYNYTYKMNHARISIRGKLLNTTMPFVQPYLSGSFGVGYNHAFGFAAIPAVPGVLGQPYFGNETTTSFAYTLGVGIQKAINLSWQAGIGYEMADWGKNTLDGMSIPYYIRGIHQAHMYTHQLQFSLSYTC